MIINKEDLKSKIPENIQVERFDMAICFYIILKIDNIPHLVTYDYNPIWNSWYPFYDDKNKTPILFTSNAKNYKELIKEYESIFKINLEEKLILAKNRFNELIADVNFDILPIRNQVIYEIKYSKSTNVYTIYKLYNYVVKNVSNKNKVLTPKLLKVKLFNLKDNNFEDLVSNAKDLLKKEDLTKYSL